MRPRPLVHLLLPLPPADVLARVRARLEDPACPCEGAVGSRELSLEPRAPRRHVFSPWISLEVRAHPSGASMRGRFGPHPHLWGLFVLLYATLVAAFIAGTTYGFVQWTLGDTPSGLYLGGGALLGLSLACSVDLLGRRVGREQMDTVHAFLAATLPEGEDAPSDAA